VRAERLLIYLKDPAQAVREMKRVAKPGGRLAIIEPDFSTTTINLPDRSVVPRALAHEADTAVAVSWLPGRCSAFSPILPTSASTRGS
jgi:ubiquinone/menaquinone biosynthesis C-methylase UbiE